MLSVACPSSQVAAVSMLLFLLVSVLILSTSTFTREVDIESPTHLRPSSFVPLRIRWELMECLGRVPDNTSPVWDVGHLPDVLMKFESSVHYTLNSSDADAQWSAMVPANSGIVHVGPDRRPFMPSMFHQLHCLDIIRRAYVQNEGTGPASRHCLNYIRQMVLCRRDLRLEAVVDPYGPHAVQPWGSMLCKDWRVVYRAHAQEEVEFDVT